MLTDTEVILSVIFGRLIDVKIVFQVYMIIIFIILRKILQLCLTYVTILKVFGFIDYLLLLVIGLYTFAASFGIV